jgi:hypothetical protein
MKNKEFDMNKVFELLELLGFDVTKESWFDEEGIEGTRITAPNGSEYAIYGWDSDCDIDELIEKIKEEAANA